MDQHSLQTTEVENLGFVKNFF